MHTCVFKDSTLGYRDALSDGEGVIYDNMRQLDQIEVHSLGTNLGFSCLSTFQEDWLR